MMTDDLLIRLHRAGEVLNAASAPGSDLVLRFDEPRHRGPRVLAVAAAVLIVIGALAALGSRPTESTTITAQLGAASVPDDEVPEAAQVLPTEDGWAVVASGELTDTGGEVTFAGPDRSATLTWSPADPVPELGSDAQRLDVAGFPAGVASYDERSHIAIWEHDGIRVVVRGDGTAAEFTELLRSFRQVDEHIWHEARPRR